MSKDKSDSWDIEIEQVPAEEVEKKNANPEIPICRKYNPNAENGGCWYGDKCKFRHVVGSCRKKDCSNEAESNGYCKEHNDEYAALPEVKCVVCKIATFKQRVKTQLKCNKCFNATAPPSRERKEGKTKSKPQPQLRERLIASYQSYLTPVRPPSEVWPMQSQAAKPPATKTTIPPPRAATAPATAPVSDGKLFSSVVESAKVVTATDAKEVKDAKDVKEDKEDKHDKNEKVSKVVSGGKAASDAKCQPCHPKDHKPGVKNKPEVKNESVKNKPKVKKQSTLPTPVEEVKSPAKSLAKPIPETPTPEVSVSSEHSLSTPETKTEKLSTIEQKAKIVEQFAEADWDYFANLFLIDDLEFIRYLREAVQKLLATSGTGPKRRPVPFSLLNPEIFSSLVAAR